MALVILHTYQDYKYCQSSRPGAHCRGARGEQFPNSTNAAQNPWQVYIQEIRPGMLLATHFTMPTSVEWFYYWPFPICSPSRFPIAPFAASVLGALVLRLFQVSWGRSFFASALANILSIIFGLIVIQFASGLLLSDLDTLRWAFPFGYILSVATQLAACRLSIKRTPTLRLVLIAVAANA